ncbi:MAG: hypothetical protein J6K32_01860 [Clostridia bacterium]|nr:hypothetical protein [Clostridia bacterium]
MAEYTNGLLQVVDAGANVLFADAPVRGGACIQHRMGSGVVTLKGMTNQCRALYRVSFGANVAIPTGGTVGPITLAIAIEGEALASATMIETPAAVETYANVYASVLVEAPRGCCVTIGVRNAGPDPVNVQNANLIVDRVA